jgi:hypothetical protein
MAIDLFSDEIVSLREAAKRLPVRRAGKRPNVATLYRWCSEGVRGVRLDSILVGGVRCTSAQALQNFCDTLTAAAEPGQPTGSVRPSSAPSNRRKEIAAAERRLARAGI